MSDLPPRRGWTVFTEEIPAEVMLDMPPDLAKRTVNFLVSLALDVGGAIDADDAPPGDPMDDLGVRYSHQIEGEPVIFEYVVLREIREIRIPALVWFR
ncbi:hypothetical protein [Streptomyces sp. NPDC058603]|uniref:hypothetical protein n=1 Tax=unclassified Streptomyces TaxID=2593676 RepID=UPI003653EC7F